MSANTGLLPISPPPSCSTLPCSTMLLASSCLQCYRCTISGGIGTIREGGGVKLPHGKIIPPLPTHMHVLIGIQPQIEDTEAFGTWLCCHGIPHCIFWSALASLFQASTNSLLLAVLHGGLIAADYGHSPSSVLPQVHLWQGWMPDLCTTPSPRWEGSGSQRTCLL